MRLKVTHDCVKNGYERYCEGVTGDKKWPKVWFASIDWCVLDLDESDKKTGIDCVKYCPFCGIKLPEGADKIPRSSIDKLYRGAEKVLWGKGVEGETVT